MGFFSNIAARFKAITSREPYLESSIRVLEGSGTLGAKPHPFNYELAVMQCRSWVYRCVFGNAEAAARVPLRLYVRKRSQRELKMLGKKWGVPAFGYREVPRHRKRWIGEGRNTHAPSEVVMRKAAQFNDNYVEVTDHVALDLLLKANPDMDGFGLSLYRFVMQELVGNAYIMPIVSPDLGRPVELWPLLPQWVEIVPGSPESGNLIDGYVYGRTRNEAQWFAREEILHFKRFHPNNIFYGMGKVEAAWQEIGIIGSQQVMSKALFDNQARPDYLLVMENGQQDQVDRISERVNSMLRGVRNAGRFLALTGKVTAQPLSWPPKDLGTDESTLEALAGVFGYPITKLKANDPNRANAETGDAGWMKDTILPMLRQDEEALNQNGYLALFGDGELAEDAFFAYDDPVPSNRKMELAESRTLVMAGIRTVNEDRELRGDAPIEGGDVLRVNGQNVLLMDQQAEAAIQAPATPGLPGLPGVGLNDAGDDVEAKTEPEPASDPTPEKPRLDAQTLKAVRELIGDVTAGTLPGAVAVELLVELGIDANRARVMMEAVEGARKENATAGVADGQGHGSSSVPGEPRDEKSADRENGDGASTDGPELAENRAVDEEDAEDTTAPRVGDWPAATRAYRKAVEFQPEDEGGDADENIRDDEPVTPAMEIARGLRKVFREQEADVLKLLQSREGKGRRKDLRKSDLKELERMLSGYDDAIQDAVRDAIERIYKAGGNAGLDRIALDQSFDVTNPRVNEALQRQVIRLAGEVNQTTIQELRDTLAQGLDNGESVTDLAKRVRGKFRDFSKSRAVTIARTESAQAYVKGQELAWQESGVVQGKVRLIAPHACDFCVEMHRRFGDTPVPLGQNMLDKGATLQTPDGRSMTLNYRGIDGPPIHPNDRCDTMPVIGEKSLDELVRKMDEARAKGEDLTELKAKAAKLWKLRRKDMESHHGND